MRGQYMNAEMSLSGIGLVVMGGLQDELFNLTVDRIKVKHTLSRRSKLPWKTTGSCWIWGQSVEIKVHSLLKCPHSDSHCQKSFCPFFTS